MTARSTPPAQLLKSLGHRLVAVPVALVVLFALILIPLTPASATVTAPSTSHLVVVHAFASGGPHPLHLVGATVRISANGKVIGSGRTGRNGLATVQVSQSSRSFEVSVTQAHVAAKANPWTWTAFETSYRAPTTVCVSNLTTVGVAYRSLNPKASTAVVDSQLRKTFGLPSWYDPACGPESSLYFNGAAFYKAAWHKGGLKGYSSSLAQRMMAHPNSQVLAYRQPGATSSATFGPKLTAIDLTSATPWSSWGSYVSDFSTVLKSLSTVGNGALAFLGPYASAASGAASVLEEIGVLSGESTGPTTQDVLNALQTDFTQLETSIQALQSSVSQIQQQVSALQKNQLAGDLAGLMANTTSIVSAVKTDVAFLTAISADAQQISCGDPTTGGNGSCTNPQPIKSVCPASTLLAWNADGGGVIYPKGWQPSSRNTLDQACINYSNLIFGENGYVANVTGDSQLGGSPSNSLGVSSLGQLAADVNGTSNGVGIVQTSSQLMTSLTRFIDTQASSIPQATFDFYLSVYQDLMLIVTAEAGFIQEPVANLQLALAQQPTVAQFVQSDPSTVPVGTVVDTLTGQMWEQQIGANVNACTLYGYYGGSGINSNPSTITASSITPSNSYCGEQAIPPITATSGTGNTLNEAPNAVTPYNPLTVSPVTGMSAAAPFSDWFAATQSQFTGQGQPTGVGLYSNVAPQQGQTSGDAIQAPPEASTPGPGIAQALFGANNANTQSVPGNGIDWVVQPIQFYVVGYTCSQRCFTLNLITGQNTCSLAGNTQCGAPSAPGQNPGYGNVGLFDLNNGTPSSPLGVFATGINDSNQNGGGFNWLTSYAGCQQLTDFDQNCSYSPTFNAQYGAIDGGGGWATWFYRNPTTSSSGGSGAASSECYYYLPQGSQSSSANTSACPTTPGASGYNGLASQIFITQLNTTTG